MADVRPAGSGGRDDPQQPGSDRAGPATWRGFGWRRLATVVGVGDVDGVFRLGTRGDVELLGWTAGELRCAPYSEWVHPDDRDRLADVADTVRLEHDRGRFCPVDVRLLAHDRHYWWTHWHVWTSTKEPPVVCATGVDYLERDLDAGPPMGAWRWDVDADTVVWSTEVLDMFALTVGPPVSYQGFLASVHEEDRAEVDRAVRWSVLSGEPYVTDFRVSAQDGGRDRWFHAAGRLETATADRTGQLCGIVKYLNPPDDPQAG